MIQIAALLLFMYCEEESILDEIAAAPDDTERRCVYADWLEERGDERWRFVRAEIELNICADQDRRHLKSAVLRLMKEGKPFDPAWKRRIMKHRLSEIMIALDAGASDRPKLRRKRSSRRSR